MCLPKPWSLRLKTVSAHGELGAGCLGLKLCMVTWHTKPCCPMVAHCLGVLGMLDISLYIVS